MDLFKGPDMYKDVRRLPDCLMLFTATALSDVFSARSQANTLANMAEVVVRRLEAGWARAQKLTEVSGLKARCGLLRIRLVVQPSSKVRSMPSHDLSQELPNPSIKSLDLMCVGTLTQLEPWSHMCMTALEPECTATQALPHGRLWPT